MYIYIPDPTAFAYISGYEDDVAESVNALLRHQARRPYHYSHKENGTVIVAVRPGVKEVIDALYK